MKNLVQSAAGGNYDRGDIITISGLQFEGLAAETQRLEKIQSNYQRDTIITTFVDSVLPLVILFALGLFALMTLKGLLDRFAKIKMPTGTISHTTSVAVANAEEALAQIDKEPVIEFRKGYSQSQKESNITELNDIVMQSPEEAAKLITSYLKD